MPNQNSTRIIKNTAFLYIRMLIIVFTSLYTVRVVLHALGEQDFGIYGAAAASIALFTFISGAMSQATLRFLSIEISSGNKVALRNTFSASFFIYAAIAIIVIALSETVGLWLLNNKLNIPSERISAANIAFQFSVAASVFTLLQMPYNALIIAHEEMWFFSIASIGDAALKLAIAYAIAHSSLDRLELYSALFFLATTIIFIVYYLFSRLRFPEAKIHIEKEWLTYKEIGSFSGWSLIGNAAAAGRTQGVNLLLNSFFGPIVNASFMVMSQAQGAISTFTQSLQTAISPQIYQSFGRGNFAQMHALVITGSKLSFLLLLVIAAPLFYCIEYLLNAWLGTPPKHAADFIRWMLAIMLTEAMALPLMTAAAATGRIKWYQITIGGILLTNIPVSYFAFLNTNDPKSFLLVSAIISCIAFAIRLIFLKYMISFKIKSYLSYALIPATLLCAISFLIIKIVSEYIFSPNSLFDSGAGSLIILATLVPACFFIGLNKKERRFLVEKISKKAKRSQHPK